MSGNNHRHIVIELLVPAQDPQLRLSMTLCQLQHSSIRRLCPFSPSVFLGVCAPAHILSLADRSQLRFDNNNRYPSAPTNMCAEKTNTASDEEGSTQTVTDHHVAEGNSSRKKYMLKDNKLLRMTARSWACLSMYGWISGPVTRIQRFAMLSRKVAFFGCIFSALPSVGRIDSKFQDPSSPSRLFFSHIIFNKSSIVSSIRSSHNL